MVMRIGLCGALCQVWGRNKLVSLVYLWGLGSSWDNTFNLKITNYWPWEAASAGDWETKNKRECLNNSFWPRRCLHLHRLRINICHQAAREHEQTEYYLGPGIWPNIKRRLGNQNKNPPYYVYLGPSDLETYFRLCCCMMKCICSEQ